MLLPAPGVDSHRAGCAVSDGRGLPVVTEVSFELIRRRYDLPSLCHMDHTSLNLRHYSLPDSNLFVFRIYPVTEVTEVTEAPVRSYVGPGN